MDEDQSNQSPMVRLILTEEEYHMPLINDLCNKYKEWRMIMEESKQGRKTRSANRKADHIFDEMMAFKIPPIKPKVDLLSPIKTRGQVAAAAASALAAVTKSHAVDSSLDSDDDSSTSSRPVTRSLRQRCRTPQQQQTTNRPMTRQLTSPCTPLNQKIRGNLRQTPSGKSASCNGSQNVLNAALNQQHPSVSVTKIRQLLRADSAQKKREEERERNERMMLDRKAKEERAEALKKQLLEERAANAKLKREQRIQSAAEVRKKREEARIQQKIKEERAKRLAQAQAANPPMDEDTDDQNHKQQQHAPTRIESQEQQIPKTKLIQTENAKKPNSHNQDLAQNNHKTNGISAETKQPPKQPSSNPPKGNFTPLNETFKKPIQEYDNIEISIQDETTEEKGGKAQATAVWTRAPHLREALVKQFSKPKHERQMEIKRIFPPVHLPVDLEQIFGPDKAAISRYLKRTSSAQWTPPNRAIKRTSSMVMTPKGDN